MEHDDRLRTLEELAITHSRQIELLTGLMQQNASLLGQHDARMAELERMNSRILVVMEDVKAMLQQMRHPPGNGHAH